MPKKHRNSFAYTKPAATAHHSLTSSAELSRAIHNAHHTRFGTGPARGPERSMGPTSIDDSSVNDLISHLRRTQGLGSAESSSSSSHSFEPQRSLPPALRNILQLPEHPAPRPRRNIFQTRINGRPRRLPPGPPAPESWSSETRTNQHPLSRHGKMEPATQDQIIYRLNRLPGGRFPELTNRGARSLQHIALMGIAMNWASYVEDVGEFLSDLPTHLKQMLLSYVAFYWKPTNSENPMNGFRPLYFGQAEYDRLAREHPGRFQRRHITDSQTIRLDLSKAIGHWLTFRQLMRALRLPSISSRTTDPPTESYVPDSWDETEVGAVPRPIQGPRFSGLRYLSLAHPKPGSVSWMELVSLTSHLPTLTHLSLAHWPVLPRAAEYTGLRTNCWADHAGILRQIARNTNCLRWLDLEGCTDWINALVWKGLVPTGNGPMDTVPAGSDGPDWNGAWRNVEDLILSPGYWIQPQPEPPTGRLTRAVQKKRQEAWLKTLSDTTEFRTDVRTAQSVADAIKALRREAHGKAIVVETAEDEEIPDINELMRLADEEY
ncbi:uncharacterized protein N7483_009872 [Penicillium malachiteum]|uniref:uncharacterized protein n=1 Tax=Penicillium malachiteum TaxID=1324776 RepID=UPI0025496186|nr:uncharacterized protein N7483_009872 [Penicillium malachiteum]KAJ5721938.1 hypothetical protein N7483_009872 [Penicillium malachiteum]